MRTSAFCVMLILAFGASAQRNRVARMAPIFEKGYYVTLRGDTVKGEIQTNPETNISFYHSFLFKVPGPSKPRVYGPQKAIAYGFDNRNFISQQIDGEKVFIERLVSGRLRFF